MDAASVSRGWEHALGGLRLRGWSGELIDDALEAIRVAREEGGLLDGTRPGELTLEQARSILEEPVDEEEVAALRVLSEVYEHVGAENEALRRALVDPDAYLAERRGRGGLP